MSDNPVVVKDAYESRSMPKYSTKNFKYTFNNSEKDRLQVFISNSLLRILTSNNQSVRQNH